MRAPRISVLIATADRPDLLSRCLSQLERARCESVEVLILDQSHRAQPLDQAAGSSRSVRHLPCARRGKSVALNRGIEEARGELLAFTDDDCLVAEDWLAVMLQAFETSGEEAALTGRVLAGLPEGNAVIAPSLVGDLEEKEYRRPAFRDVLFGNNMAIPARVMRRVGPFDETLGPGTDWPAAEDNDLGYRLLKSRVPIRYLPNMVVTHRSWRGAEQQQALYHAYGIGQGAFYGKHARRGNLHMMARMGKSLWEGCRDASGAALLGRRHDWHASLAFARGLLRGFFHSSLAPGQGAASSLQADRL
jgi:GT2 family glycosyltransferase